VQLSMVGASDLPLVQLSMVGASDLPLVQLSMVGASDLPICANLRTYQFMLHSEYW
jgi:hypothetical protein